MTYAAIRTFSENTRLIQERREHVRKCCTALFVKTPFEKATMKEILQACGMSKGGLYYYVGSKEDIRSLILDHAANAYAEARHLLLIATKGMKADDALKFVIHFSCQWMEENQDEVLVILNEMNNLSSDQLETQLNSEINQVELLEQLIQEGIQSGIFKTKNAKAIAHIVFNSTRAWVERRWYLRKHFTLEEYIDIVEQLAISFLTNGK